MLNRFMTPKEQFLVVGFIVAMLLGAAALFYNKQKTGESAALGVLHSGEKTPAVQENAAEVKTPEKEPQVESPEVPPAKIAVAVSGAVRNEGVYFLDAETRVLDALDAAGGMETGAYTEAINRAARLIDGTTLTVPWENYAETEGEAAQYRRWSAGLFLNPPEYLHAPWSQQLRAQYATAPAPNNATAATQAQSGGCVNLNTATLADLETLPGIGPAIGQRILDYREGQGFTQIEDLMNVSGIAEKRFEAIAHLVCL